MYMKSNWLILIFLISLTGCNKKDIQLNNITECFESFHETDSLSFIPIGDEVMNNPMKMLYFKEHLIIRTNASPGDSFVVDYSLKNNKIISKGIPKGNGPDEMINCDIFSYDNKIWFYDSGKQKLTNIAADSVISGNYKMEQFYDIPSYFYSIALLNDSILIGTNDFTSSSKLSYLNINNGKIETRAPYFYLNEELPLSTLIDASCCYINIHPKSRDILLSYRYTDVIEIYNQYCEIKKSLQGPDCFDAAFSIRSNLSMGKTKQTLKAFVNSYVTDKYIFLLYSGYGRGDKNWANGVELFIYSWDGEPLKRYILEQPIYAFAINDLSNELYTYSLQTGEILKASLTLPSI